MAEVTSPILTIARQVFQDEISGLLQVQQALDESFCLAVELLLNCQGKVIVSGMGKSGHIGNKIAATLASTGTAAFFMHPAEALHGDLGMIDAKDVLLALSYSGESDELAAIIPLIKRKQVKIVAISGNASSTLARFADCHLLIDVAKEACPLNLAPTSSTTASLVLGDALAVALLSLRNFQPEDFALSHPGGSLGRRLLTKVDDVMHSELRLPWVLAKASLKEVVLEISKKGLGLVAVVDGQQKLCGVITDGDIRRVLDSDGDIRILHAAEIMIKNPKVIQLGTMAVDAVAVMEEYKITSLLVVDGLNTVVGAFNMHDLFKAKLI